MRIVTHPHKETTMQTHLTLRQSVTTAEAAKALNREPSTLRKWAHLKNGPLQPVRINGRLAWPLDAIAALLKGEAL
jgi:hypothetical protein